MNQASDRTGFCPRCRCQVSIREGQFNLARHAALCVFTCLLWLPFLLFFAVSHAIATASRGRYRCTRCETRVWQVFRAVDGEPPPTDDG